MTLCFYVACTILLSTLKHLDYLQCVIQDKHCIGSCNTVLFRDWRQSAEPTNVEPPASGDQMCNSPS